MQFLPRLSHRKPCEMGMGMGNFVSLVSKKYHTVPKSSISPIFLFFRLSDMTFFVIRTYQCKFIQHSSWDETLHLPIFQFPLSIWKRFHAQNRPPYVCEQLVQAGEGHHTSQTFRPFFSVHFFGVPSCICDMKPSILSENRYDMIWHAPTRLEL